jgi:hypothetical protein
MAVIYEEQINEKQSGLKLSVDNYIENIADFQRNIDNISEVVSALNTCFNTTGGIKIKNDIQNIEFDTRSLNNMADILQNLTVNYTKERKNINK